MTFCLSDNATPEIAIEYTTSEGASRAIRNFKAAPEVVSGYPLYSDTDDHSTGWYIICPKETYNLVQNPTFFTSLGGWSEFNSVQTRTNVNSFDSGFSMLIRGSGDTVTADRRAYAEIEAEGFTAGFAYTLSGYLWQPQIFDSQDPIMGTLSIVDFDGATFEEVFSTRIEKIQKWERISVTKVIRDTATQVFVRINLRSQDQQELTPPFAVTGLFNLASEFMYADMLQLESGTEATTPFHGDYRTCATEPTDDCGPFRWLGIPHRSNSYRSDCTKDSGKLVSLSSLGFEILEHSGHGAPPVRDIFFDYANRPGGEYQKTVVDTNIITLSGYICESTLKDLECAIFGLKDKIMPDISQCRGKMLLVYVHDECIEDGCDPDRHVAYCVSYIQGFEGVRDNHFQQRLSLQFRAYDPFAFEWPGHTSHPISFNSVVLEESVVRIGPDDIQGFPLESRDYKTLTCMTGTNKFLIGGSFTDGVNESDESVNVAVYDCDEFCEHELLSGDPDGGVNVSIRDNQGNVIVGGLFSSPFLNVAIYYADIDAWGGFTHSAGEVHALATPFWADVVLGTDTGIHIIVGNTEAVYATNGRVSAFAVTPSGVLYAFGDFTTIDGVNFNRAAKFDPNVGGCLSLDTAAWEGLGFGFDGPILSADVQGDSIYVGGNFTTATPDPVELCDVIDADKFDSKGASQVVNFTDDAPLVGQITVEFQITNPVVQAFADNCVNSAPTERMIRITAKSTSGTTYSFLFSSDAVVSGTFVGTVGTLYQVELVLDKSYVLTGPCSENVLADTLQDSLDNAVLYSGIDYTQLGGGVGSDTTLNSVTVQCVQRIESFQGDSAQVNNVACISGDSVAALGDGIPVQVNKVFVHPDTGEILVGTEAGSGFTDGFGVWTGQEWISYNADFGNIGADNRIIDIDYCDCNLYILFEGNSASLLPGVTNFDYNGSVELFDFDLLLHGPGKLECFSHGQKTIRFCTELQCGEIARLNFNDGAFLSDSRDLGASIVGGSRYDIALGKCANNVKFLMTDTEPSSKATIIYNRRYWGIEALCCSEANKVIVQNTAPLCCPGVTVDIRDPQADDCAREGYGEGDTWFNAGTGNACLGFFVNTGEECCEEDSGAYSYVGSEGTILLTAEDGDELCEPDE